jgi:hypothetical protein
MRAPRRHAADAAAADLTTAYERWSAYIDPDIAANVGAVTDWLRTIPAREEAAAKATTPAATSAAPAVKAARRPGMTTRERIATQPATFALPDPTEPTDALAAANLADLNARNVTDAVLAEWASSPNPDIRAIATAELTRRASLPTSRAALTIGDAAVVEPITKRAARSAGAHTS